MKKFQKQKKGKEKEKVEVLRVDEKETRFGSENVENETLEAVSEDNLQNEEPSQSTNELTEKHVQSTNDEKTEEHNQSTNDEVEEQQNQTETMPKGWQKIGNSSSSSHSYHHNIYDYDDTHNHHLPM